MSAGNDPLGIGHLPRWRQWIVFIGLLLIGFVVVEQSKTLIFGSSEARALKSKLSTLSEQLNGAQKVGDKQAAVALLDPTTKIINDYNELSEGRRNEINNSSLRYCVLAAIHLADGVTEVYETGYWIKRDQYENALDMCK